MSEGKSFGTHEGDPKKDKPYKPGDKVAPGNTKDGKGTGGGTRGDGKK